ncbi:MAG: RDD family protein [Chloroflexi bacterium]|nr:RDD family protein [Chloroflexota bacterium]
MKMKSHTLQGHYAGFITRLFAFMIDILLVVIMLGVVSFSLSLIWRFFDLIPNIVTDLVGSPERITAAYKAALPTITPIVSIVLVFAYFIFFWMSSGQTVGKALMGVRVVSVNGSAVNIPASLIPLSALSHFGYDFLSRFRVDIGR